MPQEGTEAYLYFPEAEEGSAYAVSGIHKSRCPVFADTGNRGLVMGHGKKLQLYADEFGFLGRKEEAVQECRMGEEGIYFGAGKGKLQVMGSGQITFRAPEISLDAVQKIGQYKMESMAAGKAGMLHPGGSGNPSTGGCGDGAAELQNEYNALSSQGILAGTEYEYYKPFDDAPEYEEYKDVPTWLKVVAGVVVAVAVGLAVGALIVCTGGFDLVAAGGMAATVMGASAGALTVGAGIAAVAATAASDRKNGTESSLGDYISNAFSASAKIGGSILTLNLFLAMPAGIKGVMIMVAGGCVAKNWAMIIPQYVSNTTVLGVMDILSWLPVDEDTIENNAEHNLNQLKGNSIFDENSYIENQALWENIKFGEWNMAYSGCEIIAAYNAIKALGGECSLQHMTNLISYYEKNSASLKGEFGVVAYAIADYFKKQGYEVETSADKNPEIINAIADRSSTVIVTVYNDDRDIMEIIHTVSITKEEGKYVVHNGYNKDKSSQAEGKGKDVYCKSRRYDSVQEAIDDMNKSPEGGEASLIYIIGISES